eukprot:12241496-Alexandrium_andersonii.AAC.2
MGNAREALGRIMTDRPEELAQMLPRPPAARTSFLQPWVIQVAHEARDSWAPGHANTAQQEALLQAEHDLDEWRMGAPRTLTRVLHFLGWTAWLL